jgi:GT2 family glycosyltransferase
MWCEIKENFNYIWVDDTIMDVDVIAGYFAAFRRDLLLEIGALDKVFEAYSYGGEDFDFCLKAKAAGYKVIVDPILPVFHHGRVSSNFLGKKLENYINETDVMLFQKWKNFKHLFEMNKNPDTIDSD